MAARRSPCRMAASRQPLWRPLHQSHGRDDRFSNARGDERVAVKIAVIGGGGVRTPLLIHGLAESGVDIGKVVIYDLDFRRASIMAALSQGVAPFPVIPQARF